MEELRSSSRTSFRSPLPKEVSLSTQKHKHMADSPIDSTFDASLEPLMDDAHIDIMTSNPAFAPQIPRHSQLSSQPSSSGSARESIPASLNIPLRDSSRGSAKRIPDTRQAKHTSASSAGYSDNQGSGPYDESQRGSVSTASTAQNQPSNLPMLQTKGPPDSADQLRQVNVDDPNNFDLLESAPDESQAVYQLEVRAQQLFSPEHLHMIFQDPKLLLQFTGFLNSHRPASVRTLDYYLDALKAIRAINYANAVTRSLAPLQGLDFTQRPPQETANQVLTERAERAFQELARSDLAAWVTYTWTQTVSVSITRRITGTLAPHLREASEGLAES